MASRVTLKDVAKHANVSYQTVSKVLNNQAQVSEETRDRIWTAVENLGYRPNLIARSLRRQRSHAIGFSWEPTPPDQVNPVLDQFLQSMITATESAGYQLLTFPFREGRAGIEPYRELIDTNRVDGFILSSINYDDFRIAYLQELNYPFIAFGRSNPDWDFPYVDVDGGDGMRQVLEHLISQDHTRIAVLAWPVSSRVGQNRMEGLMNAFEHAGMNLPPAWLLRGEGSYQFGVEGTVQLLQVPANERPTAIVCFNDLMAVGAMRAVTDLGLRVGADVAITGFDDLPMTQYLTTPLTTVRQPVWEVGHKVIELLLAHLDGNPPADTRILLSPRLIVRASSLNTR